MLRFQISRYLNRYSNPQLGLDGSNARPDVYIIFSFASAKWVPLPTSVLVVYFRFYRELFMFIGVLTRATTFLQTDLVHPTSENHCRSNERRVDIDAHASEPYEMIDRVYLMSSSKTTVRYSCIFRLTSPFLVPELKYGKKNV